MNALSKLVGSNVSVGEEKSVNANVVTEGVAAELVAAILGRKADQRQYVLLGRMLPGMLANKSRDEVIDGVAILLQEGFQCPDGQVWTRERVVTWLDHRLGSGIEEIRQAQAAEIASLESEFLNITRLTVELKASETKAAAIVEKIEAAGAKVEVTNGVVKLTVGGLPFMVAKRATGGGGGGPRGPRGQLVISGSLDGGITWTAVNSFNELASFFGLSCEKDHGLRPVKSAMAKNPDWRVRIEGEASKTVAKIAEGEDKIIIV